MKSIKFLLSALVVSAMFASCAKDEMTVAPENQISGAELLGTNISVNFGNGADTKITAEGAWQETDKLGLGWLTTNLQDELDANHMFELGSNGIMTTKGNVYKGWHFGYYPFSYMEQPGEKLQFVLNPQQTEKGSKVERYNSALYLTAREFLTKKEHLDGNNQLIGVTFDLFPVLKTILVNVTPDAKFTDNSVLGDLNITSVKIDVGANYGAFPTGKVTIIPSKLAQIQYDVDEDTEEKVYNKTKTQKEFYKNLAEVVTHDGWHSEIASSTKSEDLDLSGTQTLRIHTLPTTITLVPDNIKFIIKAENGTFTVKYKNPKDLKTGEKLTDVEKVNNTAIEELVKAYAKDGALSAYNFNEAGLYREAKNFNLTITPAMFDVDFNQIDSEEAWNHAVAVANALGLTEKQLKNEPFTIVNDKDGKPWSFKDVDGDGQLVNLPANKIVVNGTMNLGVDGAWPAKGINAENAKVVVKEGVTLTVAKGVTLNSIVENNGTIDVKEGAAVKTVNNENGRIDVVYGSFVTLAAGKEAGVIAYVVTGNDKASEINELTEPTLNEKGFAYVNTLVVNDGITFDLSMIDANTGTSYNPILGKGLKRMDVTNFVLNGGTVKADAFSYEKVANVEVIGGSSKIYNVNVTGNLKVSAGKVTIDAKEVSGYKESVKVGAIDNKAQVVVNTDVYTSSISNPSGAKTTVKGEKTVWYTTNYAQGGTASGKILKLSASEGSSFNSTQTIDKTSVSATDAVANGNLLHNALVSANGGTIFLPAGKYDLGTASAGKTQVGPSANASLSTAGFTIIGEEGTVIVANDRGLRFIGDVANETEVTFNLVNVTVKSDNSQAIYAKAYAKVNLVNVTIDSPNTTGAKSIIFDTYSDANGKKGATATINAFNVNVPSKTKIEFLGAVGHTNYFNYSGGKNISDNSFVVANGYPSTGANYFVNGVALPETK